jgi:hypothetical protein
MIVAVIPVRMMQMTIHQVIHVVAMRYSFVPAVDTVGVGLPIGGRAAVVRRAFVRIRRSHLNPMVVHMIAVGVMQIAIMNIIRVAIVFHCGVPAVWAMHVVVNPRMLMVSVSHRVSPFKNRLWHPARAECPAGM